MLAPDAFYPPAPVFLAIYGRQRLAEPGVFCTRPHHVGIPTIVPDPDPGVFGELQPRKGKRAQATPQEFQAHHRLDRHVAILSTLYAADL